MAAHDRHVHVDAAAPADLLVEAVYTHACFRGEHVVCLHLTRCDCGCHGKD